jgi:asparagine synthase (glutamine-hydrolysing)
MCGFVVILNRDPAEPVDATDLAAATGTLTHRGPDDAGTWVSGSVGFGFRRLAVQDLTPAGHQPMTLDGHVLAYNGELYEFPRLRRELEAEQTPLRSRGDTEVLLHLLARRGLTEALRDLRGMYALAWWDAGRRTLSLARDPLGQKPLYLWRGPRRVVVASELKAILALPDAPRSLDPWALDAYLALGTIPEPLSAVRGVEKLAPGTFLELDARGGIARRGAHWDPLPHLARAVGRPTGRGHLARAADDLRDQLRRAVRSHLVADVPVGAFLSGGLDSAGVAALAAEARRQAGAPPLHTFSVGFAGSGLDESVDAARTASHLGTEHHAIAVTPDLAGDLPRVAWHLDEPFGVASAAATWYLARAAREHVTVALSGDGADELFGGYPWRHARLSPGQVVASLPGPARRLLARFAPPGAGEDLGGPDSGGAHDLKGRLGKWLGALGREDGAIHADLMRVFREAEVRELLHPDLLAERGPTSLATQSVERAFAAPEGADGLARALYAEARTTLCHEMLAKVDRTTMAASLEVRVPYLDLGVVEAALACPSAFKVGPRTGKRVLRRALAPLLPTAVLRGRKRGFSVPVGEWFRGPLQGWAREHLDALGRRGVLAEGAPARVLDRHLAGPHARGDQVFCLVALEAWCRVFLDAAPGSCP